MRANETGEALPAEPMSPNNDTIDGLPIAVLSIAARLLFFLSFCVTARRAPEESHRWSSFGTKRNGPCFSHVVTTWGTSRLNSWESFQIQFLFIQNGNRWTRGFGIIWFMVQILFGKLYFESTFQTLMHWDTLSSKDHAGPTVRTKLQWTTRSVVFLVLRPTPKRLK